MKYEILSLLLVYPMGVISFRTLEKCKKFRIFSLRYAFLFKNFSYEIHLSLKCSKNKSDFKNKGVFKFKTLILNFLRRS